MLWKFLKEKQHRMKTISARGYCYEIIKFEEINSKHWQTIGNLQPLVSEKKGHY